MKNQTTWGFSYSKNYGNFWKRGSLGQFIQHKPLISEEWDCSEMHRKPETMILSLFCLPHFEKPVFKKSPPLLYNGNGASNSSMIWDDTNFKDFFHENWFNVTISRNFNLLKNFREIVHRDLHSTKCSSEIFFKKNKNHYPYLLLMVCSLFFQVWPKETWLPI